MKTTPYQALSDSEPSGEPLTYADIKNAYEHLNARPRVRVTYEDALRLLDMNGLTPADMGW